MFPQSPYHTTWAPPLKTCHPTWAAPVSSYIFNHRSLTTLKEVVRLYSTLTSRCKRRSPVQRVEGEERRVTVRVEGIPKVVAK